jgi:ABC-type branched-subunit amino acid transport system ATPase component
MAALEVAGIAKNFGGLQVLTDVSFTVETGEILGLIGPNGAGKSTLFEIIGGGLRPAKGSIGFFGETITRLPPHARRRAGLCRTFQKIRLFGGLTVAENVRVAASETLPGAEIEPEVHTVLRMLKLDSKRDRLPAELTLADRKRVEIARAVVGKCRLLMLDESLSGLTSDEAAAMVAAVKLLNAERGITIVLVEHVMPVVMALAERIVVLQFGRIIANGAPREIMRNQTVIEAYLGKRKVA